MTDEIRASVRLIEDAVESLAAAVHDAQIRHAGSTDEIVPAAHRLETLIVGWFNEARKQLSTLAGDRMGAYSVEVPGVGVVARHHPKSRTKWEKDALLSAVLDSRIVDPTTGEVRDETPADRLLHVWNLGVPRTTALKERGINGDEFCRVESRDDEWTLEFRSGKADAA